MKADDQLAADAHVAKATLLRLSKSCERIASRGASVTPIAHDLDKEDYRAIARILSDLASELPDQ